MTEVKFDLRVQNTTLIVERVKIFNCHALDWNAKERCKSQLTIHIQDAVRFLCITKKKYPTNILFQLD